MACMTLGVEGYACRNATHALVSPWSGGAWLDTPEKEERMTQRTFEKILADAKTLPPDEQRQLRAKLDEWLAPVPPPLTEAEFEHQLVAQGILSPIPPPITDVAPYRQRTRIHGHCQLVDHPF